MTMTALAAPFRTAVSGTPADLPPFTSYVHLVRLNPAENQQWFYRLQWHPTLWDDRALLCVWGRVGTLGQVRVVHSARTPQADATAAVLLRLRLQHDYQLVDWH